MANKVGSFKTVETATATIRFTGGIGEDSDSSSEDEMPQEHSVQQEMPNSISSGTQNVSKVLEEGIEQGTFLLDASGEEPKILNDQQTELEDTIKLNDQHTELEDTTKIKLQLCDDSDLSTLESSDNYDRPAQSSHDQEDTKEQTFATESEMPHSEQKLPTMSSNDSGFSTWSASEKNDKISPSSDASDTARLADSLESSKDESKESAKYRQQLERMRSQRFNPFDAEDPMDVQDPFPQLSDVITQRPFDADISSSQGQSPDHHKSLSTSTYQDDSPFPKSPTTDPGFHDNSFITNAELGITEDHFGQPEGHFGLSTVEELELAIQNCKQLILQTPTQTERMKNLVSKLVQLRLKLAEAKEGPKEEDPDIKMVVGHQFVKRETKSSKHYCEKCNALIWGVLNFWYKCQGCGFCCHEKCLNLITRTCASLKVKENPQYILSICPEKGLAAQSYRCYECRTQISYQAGYSEPRQCDYTGHYYCDLCHWNDTMVTPARVLHNWDFDLKKVCRASKQFLKLMPHKAVLRIQDINPMLFNFVEELNQVKKLREEVLIMKKYFLSCKDALNSKLLLQLQDRQHFVENSDMYSLQDLMDISNDVLLPTLAKIHASFAQHIKTDCQLCQGKGFICELCDDPEVLFPFDNIAIVCSTCSTVLHRHCYMRRNQRCPKCQRLSQRSSPPQGGTTELLPTTDHRGHYGQEIQAR